MKSKSEITRNTYNKIAKAWSEKNFNSKKISSEINIFSGYVKHSGKVLDAGCGPGRHTKRLLAKGYRVVGIDFSKAMIKEAKKRVPDGEFRLMDMTKLHFPSSSFDGVWCFAALLHIDKKDAGSVLINFKRILKPGGMLGLSVKEGMGQGIEKDESGFGRYDKRFFAYYKEKELRNLIEISGFKILKVRHRRVKYNWISVFAKTVK